MASKVKALLQSQSKIFSGFGQTLPQKIISPHNQVIKTSRKALFSHNRNQAFLPTLSQLLGLQLPLSEAFLPTLLPFRCYQGQVSLQFTSEPSLSCHPRPPSRYWFLPRPLRPKLAPGYGSHNKQTRLKGPTNLFPTEPQVTLPLATWIPTGRQVTDGASEPITSQGGRIKRAVNQSEKRWGPRRAGFPQRLPEVVADPGAFPPAYLLRRWAVLLFPKGKSVAGGAPLWSWKAVAHGREGLASGGRCAL